MNREQLIRALYANVNKDHKDTPVIYDERMPIQALMLMDRIQKGESIMIPMEILTHHELKYIVGEFYITRNMQKEALEYFISGEKDGNIDCCNSAGVILMHITHRLDQGMPYFEKAAKAGHEMAIVNALSGYIITKMPKPEFIKKVIEYNAFGIKVVEDYVGNRAVFEEVATSMGFIPEHVKLLADYYMQHISIKSLKGHRLN